MEVNLECPQEFEIREPRILLVVGLIISLAIVTFLTVIGVYIGIGKFDIDVGILALCAVSIPLFIAIACIGSYYYNTFKYKDGEFLRKSFMCKTKKWNINDISYVNLKFPVKGGMAIQFFDVNNKLIAVLTDDPLAIWHDGRLRTLFYVHNIPVKGDIL